MGRGTPVSLAVSAYGSHSPTPHGRIPKLPQFDLAGLPDSRSVSQDTASPWSVRSGAKWLRRGLTRSGGRRPVRDVRALPAPVDGEAAGLSVRDEVVADARRHADRAGRFEVADALAVQEGPERRGATR